MAELTVIRWRDIPAQVTTKRGRESARVQLTDRFQEAIDAAATSIGLIGTDDYLAEWDRDTRPCGDDLEAEARAEADSIESAHPDEVLRAMIRNGGRRPDGGAA